jgi:DNA polymerase-1
MSTETVKTKTKIKKTARHERLILLDVHAIVHRAYHALPDFASSKGEPTGALYGLCSMLIKIVSDLKPDYIAACYDLPEKTYRHEAYEGYKAGRKKTDDALVAQLIRSRDVFKAFNIPMYEKAGFEADDMLGTIVEKNTGSDIIVGKGGTATEKFTGKSLENPIDIIIASGDMDTMQLIDKKRVQVYTLKKGINDTIMYDEDAVLARFGFGPKLLPDYKGLRGDPSDNIIGIKGIGEKTATDLIQAFGTIEQIYAKLKSKKAGEGREVFLKVGIKERIIGLLEQGEEEAFFSKMLATIRRDAPIEFSLPEQKWRDSLKLEPILELFSQLEFRTLGARVRDAFSFQPTLGGVLENTTSTENISESLSTSESLSGPATSMSPRQALDEQVDEKLLRETSLALWILDSNLPNATLEDIMQYARDRIDRDRFRGEGAQSIKKDFAAAREVIFAELEKQNLSQVFKEIELPLMPIVVLMQDKGVKIDRAYLADLSKKYHVELEKIQKKIYEHAGEEFNVNSPKQLGTILFEKMGLTVKNLKKTDGGARSTRESELAKMADLHPIIKLILEYRELQKLLSTYIDNIPNMLDADSRLHTTFQQAGTTTGRMSSNNPNLQNIPIKTELGRAIRNAFIANKGSVLIAFDYSQIELRIAAFLSGDKRMIEIFKKGEDVHTAVAAHVFKVPLEKVDKEMRRRAKVINFGIIYGMGINALRANLGTSRKEAQEFYDAYFENFHGLADYLERVRTEAAHTGYTKTLYGRKRYFEGIKSHIPYIKASAERMAINAPIQGTEADIVKLAMIHIQEYLHHEKLEDLVFPLLQVHDELVYEVKADLLEKVVPEIRRIMETIVDPSLTLGVPIEAHVYQGKSWGEMKEF